MLMRTTLEDSTVAGSATELEKTQTTVKTNMILSSTKQKNIEDVFRRVSDKNTGK